MYGPILFGVGSGAPVWGRVAAAARRITQAMLMDNCRVKCFVGDTLLAIKGGHVIKKSTIQGSHISRNSRDVSEVREYCDTWLDGPGLVRVCELRTFASKGQIWRALSAPMPKDKASLAFVKQVESALE